MQVVIPWQLQLLRAFFISDEMKPAGEKRATKLGRHLAARTSSLMDHSWNDVPTCEPVLTRPCGSHLQHQGSSLGDALEIVL